MTAENSTTHYSTTHCFMEVGGELLSKPNALSDLLEQHGFPTLVYCNTPSDTDLLEVLLKKRGITASKLIGYVPPQKQQRALERIASKELCALVVTDIAARSLALKDFELVINYSIQNDSDIYRQRCGLQIGSPETRLGGDAAPVERGIARKMISLVSPLDLANFHFVKKALDLEFEQIQPPSKEEIQASRAKNIIERALRSPVAQDESYRALAQAIIGGKDATATVAVLLHSMLETIPQLHADVERAASEREYADDEGTQPGAFRRGNDDRGGDDRGRDGYGRGDGGRGDGRRGQGGRGRDRNGGRGGNRGYGRDGGGRREEYRGLPRDDDDMGAEDQQPRDNFGPEQDQGESRQGHEGRGREDRRSRGDRGRDDRGGDDRNNDRRDRFDNERDERPNLVRIKEDRLYIGRGTKQGFSQGEFTNLLKEHCGVDAEQMKRFAAREMYSFADFPEEVSQKIIDGLKGRSVGSGEIFVTRAVTLTHTKEVEGSESSDENNNGHHHEDHENTASEPSAM